MLLGRNQACSPSARQPQIRPWQRRKNVVHVQVVRADSGASAISARTAPTKHGHLDMGRWVVSRWPVPLQALCLEVTPRAVRSTRPASTRGPAALPPAASADAPHQCSHVGLGRRMTDRRREGRRLTDCAGTLTDWHLLLLAVLA